MDQRTLRYLVRTLSLLIALFVLRQAVPTPSSPLPTPTASVFADVQQTQAHVTKVVDGDTIDVHIGNVTKRVRLIGINTPETVAPGVPVQCYGPEASAAMKNLVSDRDIILTSDTSQLDVDRYGRLLRYAYLGNVFVNEYMVQQGFAFEYTYDRPYQFQTQFKAAQEEARAAKRGLWSQCPAASPVIGT